MAEGARPQVENLRRLGKEVPLNLLPPVLEMGLDLFYEAFVRLSGGRPISGGSPCPISWMSVEEYADRLGLDVSVRQELHHHISALDELYMKHQAKRAEQSAKGKKSADPGRHSKGRSR